jgi:ELWxxDGT repeat protein
MKSINGVFYFLVHIDGIHGYELWKSDGTESGHILVKYKPINNSSILRTIIMSNNLP